MGIIIDTNPEFSHEIVLAIPYANWLNERGELDGVITSIDMKPFYYFCKDKVQENHTTRSIDNFSNGVQNLPNKFIHGTVHPEEKPGVLHYDKWLPPDYRSHYKNKRFKFKKPLIVISNRYNYEHGKFPRGFFDIEFLYKLFNYLKEYNVIYKRPKNTEFTLDVNEMMALREGCNLQASVDGIGIIDDYELTKYYDNVFLINDILDENNDLSYNELQLMLFSNADGFISMAGGSAMLCSYFGKKNITYVTTSRELRKGYFCDEGYYGKLSGCKVFPVRDPEDDITKRGYRDYTELFNKIKENF